MLLAQPDGAGVALKGLAGVPDTDWVRARKAQFEPVSVTPEFWIVPTWHDAPAAAFA